MHLHLLNPALRIDWPLLLSALAVGITLLGAFAVGIQIRRTRRRVLGNLERVFEQLDLLQLAAPPEPDDTAPAPAPRSRAAPFMRAAQPPAELVDYQAAARLAARGAPLAEIAERCGVVAGEARVLLALQQGAQRRQAGAR